MKEQIVIELPTPQALWGKYRESVYSQELGPEQERDTSLAFYAGIEQAFKLIDGLCQAETSDEGTYIVLRDLRRELARVALGVTLDIPSGRS